MAVYVIRDGLESDVDTCLALDHSYQTERVWQMSMRSDLDQYEISFKTERLPRLLQGVHPVSEHRIRLCLPEDQCFLVAAERDGQDVLAYLTMRYEPMHRVAWVQDLVVDTSARRQGLGSRLLNIARGWANEHAVRRLLVEVRTQNFPMISFCAANGLLYCGYNDRYLENQDIAVFFGESLA